MSAIPGTKRFNHVALTVPRDLLDETGRRELVAFHSEVFGWSELPMLTEDRSRLVFQCFSFEEFLYLHGDERGAACGELDHFGLSVASLEELEAMLARARALQEKDPRVEIRRNPAENHHGVLDLHSFYVRFLLPMWVEVQYFDWKIDPRAAAADAGL